MVSIEEFGLIISLVSGTIIPIVFFLMMRHLKGSDNTSDKANTAAFNVSFIGKQINEIKEKIDENQEHSDKRIDSVIITIEKKDERSRSDTNRIWEKLEILHSDIKLHEYRLGKIDGGNNKK